jgi:hypothetical protein
VSNEYEEDQSWLVRETTSGLVQSIFMIRQSYLNNKQALIQEDVENNFLLGYLSNIENLVITANANPAYQVDLIQSVEDTALLCNAIGLSTNPSVSREVCSVRLEDRYVFYRGKQQYVLTMEWFDSPDQVVAHVRRVWIPTFLGKMVALEKFHAMLIQMGITPPPLGEGLTSWRSKAISVAQFRRFDINQWMPFGVYTLSIEEATQAVMDQPEDCTGRC